MKLTLGILIGAGITLLAHFWARPTAWVFYRIPPATHPDCAPRYRTWDHGVEQPPGSFPE